MMMEGAVLVGACGIVGGFLLKEACSWLRNAIPKSVRCWFCHHKTEVDHSMKNSWFCPKCEQYNGFGRDGDYNAPVHRQYNENLNFTLTTIGRCKNGWSRGNRLCNRCNLYQELKIQQLASFVPLNERNYNKEIEHFREQLEKAYKLCTSCENLLANIFKSELEYYSMPRKLAYTVRKTVNKTGSGFFLGLVILCSLILVVRSFLELRPSLSQKLRELFPPVPHHIQAFVQSYGIKTTLTTDDVLIAGIILNLILCTITSSIVVLLNGVSWGNLLCLSKFAPSEYQNALQVAAGTVSLIVSILMLSHRKETTVKKFKLEPRPPKFDYPTRSPSCLPQRMPPIPATLPSFPFERPLFESSFCSPQDILEPRIRSLRLGTPPRFATESLLSSPYDSMTSLSSSGSQQLFGQCRTTSSTPPSEVGSLRRRNLIISPSRFMDDSLTKENLRSQMYTI